jgi:hypothetical protein
LGLPLILILSEKSHPKTAPESQYIALVYRAIDHTLCDKYIDLVADNLPQKKHEEFL